MSNKLLQSTKLILFILSAFTFVTSCRSLNPSRMFKAPKEYVYSEYRDTSNYVYKLAQNDRISFQMYTNDGYRMIDLSTLEQSGNLSTNNYSNYLLYFTLDAEGYVKMPVIGKVKLSGKTIREAEIYLQNLYSNDYKKPYIILNVMNNRVFVFNGQGSLGKTVMLLNNNTNLIEVLADAGGINYFGKAYKIKVIRGNLNNPVIYNIDLSKIENVKQAGLIMQSGDIVYVEPQPQYASNILTQISPYITLLSSLVLLFSIINNLK